MFDETNSSHSLSPDEAKASPMLKGIFLLNFCINLFGTLLHLGLILITLKSRRFHSTCNWLIALNSLAIIFAYLLVLCPLWLLWIWPNAHLALLPCFFIQLLPLFATFHVFSLMLAIGFDRLLSAFWAIWYISRNERFCFYFLLFISITFPSYITGLALTNVLSKPTAEKLCTLGDILGRQSSFVSICCLVCILLSVCCYSLVWIRLKRDIRRGRVESVRTRQPIFRSLCFILCLQVGGWIFGQLAYGAIYMNETRISPLARWQLNTLISCFLSLAAALDVPILYSTSMDYKAAFNKQFPWLIKFGGSHHHGEKKSSAIKNLRINYERSTPLSRSPVANLRY